MVFITGVFTLFVLLLSYRNSYAYLDPGTGSMLLQGLIAGILIVCTSIGIFWRRLKDLFSKLIDRKKE